MKPALAIVLCLTFSAVWRPQSNPPGSSPPSQRGAAMWKEFLSYENQDFRVLAEKLDDEQYQKLWNLLCAFVPEAKDEVYEFRYSPLCLLRVVTTDGAIRYIFVENKNLHSQPNPGTARLRIFDAEGRLLSVFEFSTGWNGEVVGAWRLSDTAIDATVIEFSIGWQRFGRDELTKQYYALLQDAPVLLRIEDERGNAGRNPYAPAGYEIGPLMPERSEDEWERGLLSESPAEILRTLIWLGGRHWDMMPSSPGPLPPRALIGESKYADVIRRLHGRASVKERLNQLKDSKNRWISEAAELAKGVR